jgi:hypothetical protein
MMSMWRFSESPLVDGDRLVVTPGAKAAALVALNKMTGGEIWRAALPASIGPKGADGAGYSSAVISNGAGVKQYVQLMGRGLLGIRATDGKVLWHYNRVANNVANISTPVVNDDYVFASSAYQTGSALIKLSKSGDGVDATEVYFLPPTQLQSHHGGFVLVGDHIYGGHGHRQGFPFSLHMLTGTFKFGPNLRNAGQGSAAVTYADGRLYYRYENGKVLLIEATPEAYREHGSPSRVVGGRRRRKDQVPMTPVVRYRHRSRPSDSRRLRRQRDDLNQRDDQGHGHADVPWMLGHRLGDRIHVRVFTQLGRQAQHRLLGLDKIL